MKLSAPVFPLVGLLLLASASAAFAQTALASNLKLPDGRTLTHPSISRFDGQSFSVEHDGGIAKVPWEQMPEPARAGYTFDPDRARDERRRELAQMLNVRPIKAVETDVPAFIGKRFSFQGTIELDTYYNYAYRGAETTHFAFRIKDAKGTCHAYMPKVQAEQLRATLLSEARGKQEPQTFVCTILPARYTKGQIGGTLVELLACGADAGTLVRGQ